MQKNICSKAVCGRKQLATVPVIYCCISNYRKFSSLKQHTFSVSSSVDLESRHSLARPSAPVSHRLQLRCWPELETHLGLQWERICFQTDMVVGRIPFLVGCWPEAALSSCYVSPSISQKESLLARGKLQSLVSYHRSDISTPSLYSMDSLASPHSKGGNHTGERYQEVGILGNHDDPGHQESQGLIIDGSTTPWETLQ